MAKLLFQRVADEARPPAILGRPGCGPPDYFTEVLLNDLVESGAWLDLELKRPFLALWVNEAYSAAGEMGFSWWLVEHYLPHHVNRPDGCGLGEPARGRKDPPYFQMSYGSFDHIPDLVDSFVESPLLT